MKHLATNSLSIHKIQPMTLTVLITILVIVIHPIHGAISSRCTAENLAIQNYTELQAIVPLLECILYDTAGDSCTVDFQSEANKVATMCRDLGYQFIQKNIIANCSAELNGTKYNADYYYLNFPYCIGPSCNSTESDEVIQNNVEYPIINPEFEASGFDQCDVSAVTTSQPDMMTIFIAAASIFSLIMM